MPGIPGLKEDLLGLDLMVRKVIKLVAGRIKFERARGHPVFTLRDRVLAPSLAHPVKWGGLIPVDERTLGCMVRLPGQGPEA